MRRIEFTHTTPDGQELYYQGWAPAGEPKGVLCLVHGLGEHSGRYAPVAEALNNAGYALLGFDQRGHGKTPGPRGVTPPFERLMDDIGLLLDEAGKQFRGVRRFLYGHSMGGSWVLNYALRCKPQIAGVISTSPALRTAFAPPAARVLAGKILYKVAPNFVLPNALELEGISRDEIILNAYKGDPLVHDKMSARLALDILRQGEWALQHAADFPPIPLLLVHGSCDRITSAPATEEFAGKVKATSSRNACAASAVSLKLWPECYHETHNEPEKDQVIYYMINWLDGIKE